jgi:hypothetical protein
MSSAKRTAAFRYGRAVIFTVRAVALRCLLGPWPGDGLRAATLDESVTLTVWPGGCRPSQLVPVPGSLASDWLLIEPRRALRFHSDPTLIGLCLYLLSRAMLIDFGVVMHQARSKAKPSEVKGQSCGGPLRNECAARRTTEGEFREANVDAACVLASDARLTSRQTTLITRLSLQGPADG